MNALPAPSPLREVEHAERAMLAALDRWLETEMGSTESVIRHGEYMEAIEAHEAAVTASVTETKR